MERCGYCNQRIKPTRRHTLNKNSIIYLINITLLIKKEKKEYIETDQMYGIKYKGSNTAENTKLKYFGAIESYYTGDEADRGVKRSGKWKITPKGIRFLKKIGTLPSWVEVQDEEVIDKGQPIYIYDQQLKFFEHSDYWEQVKIDNRR